MEHGVLVYVLVVLGGGVAAQWLGWLVRIPPIVLLLVGGILAGPAIGVINPSHDLGPLLRPLTGLAVAIIVFEGGLNLRLTELRAAAPGVRRLVLGALPLNWALGTMAAHWIGGTPWTVAALIGAILTVTGPTVILPLLRQARLSRRPAALLKWEAVINDPVGAVLTIIVLQVVLAHGEAAEAGIRLLPSAAGAVALGLGMAWVTHLAFSRDMVPENLRLPILISGTLMVYAAGNLLYREAGLIAATLFGTAMAQFSPAGLEHLRRTQEALTVLLVSALFILLAADIDRAVIARLSWRVVAFVAVIMLVVRPLAVLLATMGDGTGWRERLLVAWGAPRGIVAAAISGIAGEQLASAGQPGADLVQPMVFAVIVATVLAQGLTLAPLARLLGLRNSERPGLLVVGMSPWAMKLAQTLEGAGVPVVLADRSWHALRPAREAGLKTAAIEVLSERAEEMMESSGVDYLLAATDDDAYNALVCSRLAPELGRERVHQLALGSGRLDAHSMPGRTWRGKVVGDRELDFATANDLFNDGWEFELLHVGAEAPPASDQRKPLLAIRPDGGLDFHSPESGAAVKAGDLLLVFHEGAEMAATR